MTALPAPPESARMRSGGCMVPSMGCIAAEACAHVAHHHVLSYNLNTMTKDVVHALGGSDSVIHMLHRHTALNAAH